MNFSYLSVLQLFIIVFPLLTYPYLLRVIGLELYGVIIFSQAIVVYVSLLINFGFNMSSSKDVAVHKSDPRELSRIVSSTYLCKFILWIICLVVYMTVITVFPFFKQYYWIYFLSFMLTFNELMLPIWFFQGIEKMKYITLVNLSARLLFVIAIFVFVKNEKDYLYVPLLNGIGAIVAGLISLYIVVYREKATLVLVPFSEIKSGFKVAFPLFVSTLSTQIYVNVNKLIIGSFLGMSDVTIYDLAEKVVNVIKLPIMMISQTVFPKISRERNIKFVNKVMFLVVGIVSVVYLFLFFGSKWIVYLFTGHYIDEVVSVIRILGLSAIFVSFNYFLGGNRLVPFGYSSTYMKVMIGNCLFFLLGVSLLWITGAINIYTITVMAVLVEFFCLISLYRINKKLKLLR